MSNIALRTAALCAAGALMTGCAGWRLKSQMQKAQAEVAELQKTGGELPQPQPTPAPLVAVYGSEANFAQYKGVYQSRMKSWLEAQGCNVEEIGDEAAADPKGLERFDLVTASSTYIVPESARAGLAEYVRQGGMLLWMDSPARVGAGPLRETLGIKPGGTYVNGKKAGFSPADPRHPVTFSLSEFRSTLVGNPATEAAANAKALAVWKCGEEVYPAVVETRSGKGTAILINWIPWLRRSRETNRLLDSALDYLIALRQLQSRQCILRIRVDDLHPVQPEPLRFHLRVLARSGFAMKQATLKAELLSSGVHDERSALVSFEPAGAVAIADWSDCLKTDGLSDGEYAVRIAAVPEDSAPVAGSLGLTLCAEAMAKLAAEEEERADLLRPLLVGTLGDYDAEPRTPEGRVDIPRLVEQIRTANMNMYDWLIWHDKRDWEDLRAFLPEAQKLGIKVWITICPPSEQGGGRPYSEPFRLDFVRWAREVGALSKEFDCIVAFVIDDFCGNRSTFTPDYLAQIAKTLREQNPKVAFLPVVYWRTIGNEDFLNDCRSSIDGIVFPYSKLVEWGPLREQLKACREWLGPNKFVLVNVYASGSDGRKQPGPRTADYMTNVLKISRDCSDGIRIYCLPKGELLEDHRYRIAAELYGKWSREGK